MSTSFASGNGLILTDFDSANDQVRKILYLSSEKLLAVGLTTNHIPNTYVKDTYRFAALSKYNQDGSVDFNFGIDGLLILENMGVASDAIELFNGNILIITQNNVVCLNPDGSLYTNYGTGGLLKPIDGTTIGFAAQAPDGSIFLTLQSFAAHHFLVKYSSSGVQDIGFANNGRGLGVGLISDIEPAKILALQDGSLIAVGTTGNGFDFGLVKYSSSGILDSTFGNNGVAHANFYGIEYGLDVVQQVDGKLLVCGSTHSVSGPQIAVARFSDTGALDPTFDSDGKLTFSINSEGTRATSILVQSDEKILVSGYSGSGSSIFVIRLNSDGSLDSTFGVNGLREINSSMAYHYPRSDRVAMTIQADGKIVLGAYGQGSSTDDFLIIRLNSDGSFDNGSVTNETVTSTVTATLDEQDTGSDSLSSAYSDAPASTATTFTLAIGQQNIAKGLLNPGLLADSDSYKLGELSAGNYKFTAKGSSWFSSSDFSGSVTPTLALYDSAGKVVATSSTGTLEYSVAAKGSFFLYVTGAGSQKSQYEVYYESIQAGKQFTGDETDNQIVGTDGNDVISAGGGNDVITGGSGDDTIDGGAGFDSAIWSGSSKNFDVSFNAGIWTVKDNSSGLGTDTVKNVENLQFTDRSVLIQSEAHGSYADLPADLYQFFIVAFNAAPGVTYMNQLAEAYRFGLSVKEIVDIYVTKSQFTDLYPTTLTNKELAIRLVENIVKDSATASIKASAAEDIEAAMSVGYSRADVLYTVFGNLANKPFTDPTWGNTAKFFANQIAVAKAYTEVMDQSTTDLATLRSALAAVTKDSSVTTDNTAIEVVIDGLFGNTPPASASTPLGFASLNYFDEEDPDTTYPTVDSTDELLPPALDEPYRWVQYDVMF